jgi:hypothetical protein
VKVWHQKNLFQVNVVKKKKKVGVERGWRGENNNKNAFLKFFQKILFLKGKEKIII